MALWNHPLHSAASLPSSIPRTSPVTQRRLYHWGIQSLLGRPRRGHAATAGQLHRRNQHSPRKTGTPTSASRTSRLPLNRPRPAGSSRPMDHSIFSGQCARAVLSIPRRPADRKFQRARAARRHQRQERNFLSAAQTRHRKWRSGQRLLRRLFACGCRIRFPRKLSASRRKHHHAAGGRDEFRRRCPMQHCRRTPAFTYDAIELDRSTQSSAAIHASAQILPTIFYQQRQGQLEESVDVILRDPRPLQASTSVDLTLAGKHYHQALRRGPGFRRGKTYLLCSRISRAYRSRSFLGQAARKNFHRSAKEVDALPRPAHSS